MNISCSLIHINPFIVLWETFIIYDPQYQTLNVTRNQTMADGKLIVGPENALTVLPSWQLILERIIISEKWLLPIQVLKLEPFLNYHIQSIRKNHNWQYSNS